MGMTVRYYDGRNRYPLLNVNYGGANQKDFLFVALCGEHLLELGFYPHSTRSLPSPLGNPSGKVILLGLQVLIF